MYTISMMHSYAKVISMTLTRSHLRRELQDVGFTYREARDLVGTILDVLSEALKRGIPVETSFGTLTPTPPKPRRAYRLGRIVTINKRQKIHFKKVNND